MKFMICSYCLNNKKNKTPNRAAMCIGNQIKIPYKMSIKYRGLKIAWMLSHWDMDYHQRPLIPK